MALSSLQAAETSEYVRKRAAELAAAQNPTGDVAAAPPSSVSWPEPAVTPGPSWPVEVPTKPPPLLPGLHRQALWVME